MAPLGELLQSDKEPYVDPAYVVGPESTQIDVLKGTAIGIGDRGEKVVLKVACGVSPMVVRNDDTETYPEIPTQELGHGRSFWGSCSG